MAEEPSPELIVVQNEAAANQPSEAPQQSRESIQQPGKLLRIATMTRELLEEVRQTKLDEAGRKRLQQIYEGSVKELDDVLPEDLAEELRDLAAPFEGTPSEAEIRLAQAQLLGWLEGLFHGIQAALWAQQMQARSALEEMRRRGLPSGHTQGPGPHPQQGPQDPATPPGQYL